MLFHSTSWLLPCAYLGANLALLPVGKLGDGGASRDGQQSARCAAGEHREMRLDKLSKGLPVARTQERFGGKLDAGRC